MQGKDVFVYGNDMPNKLSQEEFLHYYNLSKSGDIEARNKLIEHNLRLVYKTALKISSVTSIVNEDLVSVGTMGLISAVDNYDINRNCSFSYYAIHCITAAIRWYCSKINKKIKPSISINNNQLAIIDEYNTMIIDHDITDNSSQFLINNFLDKNYIDYLFEILSDRDKDIIKMYFGLGEYNREYTEKEIAQKYGFETPQGAGFIIRDRLKRLKKSAEDIEYREKQILKRQKKIY